MQEILENHAGNVMRCSPGYQGGSSREPQGESILKVSWNSPVAYPAHVLPLSSRLTRENQIPALGKRVCSSRLTTIMYEGKLPWDV